MKRTDDACRIPCGNHIGGNVTGDDTSAPMTDRSPMLTPGQIIAPPPTHTSEPMVIGFADSSPCGAPRH